MNLLRGFVVAGALLALPSVGSAQEAVISGLVTDTTGGVMPGVTITARHVASGNLFEAVTDQRGAYRIGVRTGGYELTAELQGFATLGRKLELLVGQTAVVNLQMTPAALEESVTVTGEAPLVDVTASAVGGVIDPRQVQELPFGRFGKPEEVGAAIAFLASPKASWISGTTVVVDGCQSRMF